MSDRTVAVKLKLEVADFVAGARQAGSSLEQALAKAGKGETVANTGLGRMEQSMRVQSQSWSTLGTSMLAVGGAAAAIGAAVAKTGIEYNTLQQSSRMALSTMLGGMQSASAQMDKLDAFARTSPFAKQTFIKAQQQMLAFGIETRKVIPYLDAVQNAVAAAGGSNAELESIVTIMAKIKSSAKITAMDLNQFGNHGIAAAELIGEAMGKTGAQIREEITAGTLDADEALDALVEGMSTKFDGAAAGLKTTMTGAIDRVKGAWRDLSATMMAPLVDPEGGGLLVTATNKLADFLRLLESAPAPVQQAVGLLGGLTATAGILGGTFLLLAPRIRDTIGALSDLGITGANGWLAKMGPAAGTAAMGLVKFATAAAATGLTAGAIKGISESVRGVEDVDQSVANVTNRLKTGADGVSYYQKIFGDLVDSKVLDKSGSLFADLGDAVTRAGRASKAWYADTNAFAYKSGLGGHGTQEVVDRVKALDEALSGMDFNEAAREFQGISKEAIRTGATFDDVKLAFPRFAEAVAEAANVQGISVEAAWEQISANGALEGSTDAAATAIRDSAAAAQAAYEALRRLESATDAQASANGSLIDAQLASKEAMAAFYNTLEAGQGQLQFTADGQLDVASSSSEMVSAIRSVVDARNAELAAMAAAGAGAEELAAFTAESERVLGEMAAAAGVATDEVSDLSGALGLVTAIDPIVFDISADTSMADADIDALVARTLEEHGTIMIDARDDAALATLLKTLGIVDNGTGVFEIDSNTDPANARFLTQLGIINTETGVLDIDADTMLAAEKNRGIKLDIDTTTGSIKISGQDVGALSLAYNLRDTINDIRANIKVGTVSVGGGATEQKASGWADGGIIRSYAYGGFENHVAQIAAPGVTRRWNEPEAGGEAYIPYAIQKRARSVAITRQVANDFGYDLVKRKSLSFASGWPNPSVGAGTVRFPERLTVDGTLKFDSDGLVQIIDGRVVKYV